MDIAIIGMAGRFPEARNLHEFYENLCNGRDSVREISAKRLINTSVSLEHRYQVMGYLEDIDQFDYSLFNLSLAEAQAMDPRQRLLLEIVYEVFENAGYSADFFNGSRTSVYLGDTDLDYHAFVQKTDPTFLTGNLNSITAGRIARFFNLRGSALMIDTACSSSLVALHYACSELIAGETDHALVGGVNLVLFPPAKVNIGQTVGIASPDGRAKSFSAEANGTGCGEAVSCILLKPLSKAIHDNDNIYAVIKGTAVNQDAGLSASLTAPDSIAQSEVLEKAWRKAAIDPATLTYIEAHGTGTKLGDPIEIEGINLAFAKFTSAKQFCALSTVKTNIGHTDSVAGLVGLVKAALSLKYKKLFPSLHFNNPNPFIDFINSPAYVNTTLKDWEVQRGQVRRAGVSSFGLSGTNCHVVLEEAMASVENRGIPAEDKTELLFTISGNDHEALQRNTEALKKYLEVNEGVNLSDVSYTLNSGKKHLGSRYAIIARTRPELISLLGNTSLLETNSINKPSEKIIFTFSNSILVDEEDIEYLRAEFDSFNHDFAQCTLYQDLFMPLKAAEFLAFSFQYCFFRLLASNAVKTNYLFGDGIGKIVIAAIAGKMSLAQAFEALSKNETENLAVVLSQRLRDIIDRESKHRICFVEIGLKGNVSSELRKIRSAKDSYEVVSAGEEFGKKTFLYFIKSMYLALVPFPWKMLYGPKIRNRLPLPSYSFSKKRCWAVEPTETVENKLKHWLYELTWRKTDRRAGGFLSDEVLLIFMDGNGLAQHFSKECRKHNCNTIHVYPGDAFEQRDDYSYTLNVAKEEDYFLLRSNLRQRKLHPDRIIHLTGYADHLSLRESDVNTLLATTLYGQFFVVKAFDDLLQKRASSLVFVTKNGLLIGDESVETLSSIQTSTHGFAKGVKEEYPLLNIKCIDLAEDSPEVHVESLLNEISAEGDALTVAFRHGERYISEVRSLPAGKMTSNPGVIKSGGIYLITGGASGIGLELAKYIGKKYNATLILLGRSKLPSEESWMSIANDHVHPNHEVIRSFIDIQRAGSKVQYHAVDLQDNGTVKFILDSVKERHGHLNGIIHAAGIPGKKRIKNHTIDTFSEAIIPKIHGTVLLDRCIDYQLDFFVLFSSLNAIIGAERNSNYSAANIFQDSYVQKIDKKVTRAISINWTGWLETGMLFRLLPSQEGASLKHSYLLTSEGIAVFEFLLNSTCKNPIVSKDHPGEMGPNPYYIFGENGSGALKQLPASQPEQHKTHFSGTQIENFVANLWMEILKVDDLELHDSFFDLGGHSLNGIRVVNHIEKQYGIKLEVEDLFEFSTVSELSKLIARSLNDKSLLSTPAVISVEEKNHYDVSHGQKGLYLKYKFKKELDSFNIVRVHKVEHINLEIVTKTFEALIRRHESLRTAFITIAGIEKLSILEVDELDFKIDFQDLEGSTETDLHGLIEAMAAKPFNLEKPPLFNVSVHHIGNGVSFLVFIIDHIISDGWSIEILEREYSILYNAFMQGQSDPLEPLKIQLKDYGAWQEQALLKTNVNEHRDYWHWQFAERPPLLNLPVDFPYPPGHSMGASYKDVLASEANQHFIPLRPHELDSLYGVIFSAKPLKGAAYKVVISEQVYLKLKELSQKSDTTLFTVLTASVNIFLNKLTGVDDIVIGTPVSLREHEDLQGLIGWFLDTLLLRNKIDETQSIVEFIKTSSLVNAKALAHRSYPFEMILHDLNISFEAIGSVFIHLLNFETSISNRITDFKAEHRSFGTPTFDVNLTFYEYINGLELICDYRTSLFTPGTIEGMMNSYLEILEYIVTYSNKQIKSLEYSFQLLK